MPLPSWSTLNWVLRNSSRETGIEDFELMVFWWYYVLLGFTSVHSLFLMFWSGRIEAYAWQQIRQSLFRTPGSHFSMSCFYPILKAIICSSGLTLAGWHKCLTAYHCVLIHSLQLWVISIPSCIYTLVVTLSGHYTLFSSIVLPLDVIY